MQTPPNIVAAAQRAQRATRVPASVSIAQWRLESGNGAHSPGNNPFGMKPRAGRGDAQQMLPTTEFYGKRTPPPGAAPIAGKPGYYRVWQPFRVFASIDDAFEAHAELLSTAPVYAAAMRALPNLDAFVRAMGARYATDPEYADKLLAIIDQSGLRKYDA